MTKEQELVLKYEGKILDIIQHLEEFTQSDLQGAIEAQLLMLIRETKVTDHTNE